ncbi:MAG TPA: class I SAM-dependent methyltransferase [Saprospiraceae bacterium]|nr:class I SAM-dependent methyltransferase [Saprospiraceae bacterium]
MFQRLLFLLRRMRYPGSAHYWERRYASGGDSGSGSGGQVAAFKADFLNRFVAEKNVRQVLELGCGDGRQLSLAQYPAYTGLDISPAAIAICRRRFAGNPARHFQIYHPESFQSADFQADLTISLEVIFHLTEQDAYERHLRHLFACATQWVVIFSADEERPSPYPHYRLRRFTPDVGRLAPGWQLLEIVPNPYPGESVSQFFVFGKNR